MDLGQGALLCATGLFYVLMPGAIGYSLAGQPVEMYKIIFGEY